MRTDYLIPGPARPRLAYVHTAASPAGKHLPGVVFCGGYRSDMSGTKALYLEQKCRARGQAYTRFDYRGHGLSEGTFEEGSIGAWKADALAVLDHVTAGGAIIVGSSMGGWIGLLAALARPGLVKGFAGIAAAPDFSEDIYRALNPEQRQQLHEKGFVSVPNQYGAPPYHYTLHLYEEAKAHLLLDQENPVPFPIRLIHGGLDRDVPSSIMEKIKAALPGPDTRCILIPDGEHRLSRPEDLAAIDAAVQALSESGRM